MSVQVCLSLLVPDFFDVLCSVFRHCQCFHKAFFSFCHEILILNNCLKVVFECVFFSFCHEICILNKRLKVIFEWVFFYTGNIATSHFFWLFSICLWKKISLYGNILRFWKVIKSTFAFKWWYFILYHVSFGIGRDFIIIIRLYTTWSNKRKKWNSNERSWNIYYSKIMKIYKLIALRHENRKLFITNEKIINTNRTLQHLIWQANVKLPLCCDKR